MAIRILRLIEYVYEDEGKAAEDQLRWTLTRNHPGFKMRSAVTLFEAVEWSWDEEMANADLERSHIELDRLGIGDRTMCLSDRLVLMGPPLMPL